MIRTVKTFSRPDHTLIVDTTSGKRIVTRIPKGEPLPKPPSIVRKAANFTRAAVGHVKAGRPVATDEQVAERFAICQGCRLFNATSEGQGTCNHPSCGCDLKRVGIGGKNKLRWADQKCPIGRWSSVAVLPVIQAPPP